ncbi:MAG: (Na+)-NQR maturation NqrM [Gammaproteobacteria bacterium]
MTTLFLTLIIFIIMFTAMMVGIIFGRMPIQGSCGGLGNKCSSCSKPCSKKSKELT